ncbi:hypothetical protein [Roseivivax sp.]
MAQVPATPKTMRWQRLTAARLFGPKAVARSGGLQASERAALALRAARDDTPRRPAQKVIFLIPLVAPAQVGDWAAVTARLAGTLQSFRAQDNPNWEAVICCQEAPPLPEDARIRHLPFDDATPGNDKWRKLAALARDLGQNAEAPAFAMSFDADDLLRQGTVARMLEGQGPGWLVETGFVRDVATGEVAVARPASLSAPRQRAFWKLCGSCAALHHDPALPQSAAFLGAMWQHEHRMFPYLARLAGLPLRALPAPAVLYELNHGENFGARRGRVSFKTRFVAKYATRVAAHRRAVAEEFG